MGARAVGFLVCVIAVMACGSVFGQAANSVTLQQTVEKCGFGPFGQRMYLHNGGANAVQVELEKTWRLRREPRSQTESHVVGPHERKYVGCTRSVAKNGPTYKYRIVQVQ